EVLMSVITVFHQPPAAMWERTPVRVGTRIRAIALWLESENQRAPSGPNVIELPPDGGEVVYWDRTPAVVIRSIPEPLSHIAPSGPTVIPTGLAPTGNSDRIPEVVMRPT